MRGERPCFDIDCPAAELCGMVRTSASDCRQLRSQYKEPPKRADLMPMIEEFFGKMILDNTIGQLTLQQLPICLDPRIVKG